MQGYLCRVRGVVEFFDNALYCTERNNISAPIGIDEPVNLDSSPAKANKETAMVYAKHYLSFSVCFHSCSVRASNHFNTHAINSIVKNMTVKEEKINETSNTVSQNGPNPTSKAAPLLALTARAALICSSLLPAALAPTLQPP